WRGKMQIGAAAGPDRVNARSPGRSAEHPDPPVWTRRKAPRAVYATESVWRVGWGWRRAARVFGRHATNSDGSNFSELPEPQPIVRADGDIARSVAGGKLRDRARRGDLSYDVGLSIKIAF